MGGHLRRSSRRRLACYLSLAASLSLASLWVAAAPVGAQDGDLCGALTGDELAAALPGAFDPPSGFAGTCQWHGTSAAGGAIDIIIYSTPGTAADFAAGATEITVGERPAFTMLDPTTATPTQVVLVDLDGEVMILTLATDDASIDVATAATTLAGPAAERVAAGTAAGSGTDEGTTSTDGTDAAAPPTPCDLATPDAIADAAGVKVRLTAVDYETACSYEGGSGNKHVMIYVSTQDPSTFEGMIASVGATAVDGPGDTNWWWKDYASLFSRKGDLVLQVAIQSGNEQKEAKLQATARAVMAALLADA